MKSKQALSLVTGIGLVVGCWLLLPKGAANPITEKSGLTIGDSFYDAGDMSSARVKYTEFIDANRTSADPEIQDEVAVARLRLAYVAAKDKDFVEARAVLLEAATEYKGHGYSSQYGTLPEQAAYQAAVCLAAEGKKAEAEAAFVNFIKENGRSALAIPAFRRLERLNSGKAKPEHEALIQAAVTEREAYIRRQRSLCGPKAIKEVLRRLKLPDVDIDELARQCSMDDTKGTTIAGMIAGLEANGLAGAGIKLAYRDLTGERLPLIWLDQSHYLVIVTVDRRRLTVYDPADDSISIRELPKEGLDNQTLDVIRVTNITDKKKQVG